MGRSVVPGTQLSKDIEPPPRPAAAWDARRLTGGIARRRLPSRNRTGKLLQRRDAEIAEISAELMPRRRRCGMGGETSEECPQEWGHGSLKGYSTGGREASTSYGGVSGEKTFCQIRHESNSAGTYGRGSDGIARRLGFCYSVGRAPLTLPVAHVQSKLAPIFTSETEVAQNVESQETPAPVVP